MKKQGRWLVAVSCGPDSMALLDMMRKKMCIGVAHVNYHHQTTANQQEQFIRSYCKKHGLALHIFNVPFIPSGNFEASAREHRYAFFSDVIQQYHYQGLIVGHHLDDHLETYLLQEKSGRIPLHFGLQKITKHHGIWIYRPLLNFQKKDLINYVKRHHIPYFIDETNQDTTYTRNYIRHHDLIHYDFFQKLELKRKISSQNDQRIVINQVCQIFFQKPRIEVYRTFDKKVQLTILDTYFPNTTTKYKEEIHKLFMNKAHFIIQRGNQDLVLEEGNLKIVDRIEKFCYVCQNKEELFSLSSPYFRVEKGIKTSIYSGSIFQTDFPIKIRSYREEDKIVLRFGTKKINRFMIDRHIPIYLRNAYPVIENKDGIIIYVAGIGCCKNHFQSPPDFNIKLID